MNWQPIGTAPQNEPVLVSDWKGYWLVTDNKHGPYPLRGGHPTHWMPLPEPPK